MRRIKVHADMRTCMKRREKRKRSSHVRRLGRVSQYVMCTQVNNEQGKRAVMILLFTGSLKLVQCVHKYSYPYMCVPERDHGGHGGGVLVQEPRRLLRLRVAQSANQVEHPPDFFLQPKHHLNRQPTTPEQKKRSSNEKSKEKDWKIGADAEKETLSKKEGSLLNTELAGWDDCTGHRRKEHPRLDTDPTACALYFT